MTALFSIPMNTIMLALLSGFVLVTLVVGGLAFKHRLLVKLGLRNIPRRRAQSLLIVIGLMLATAIVTSAFATGDTMSFSIRSLATKQLGAIDEIITARTVSDRPDSIAGPVRSPFVSAATVARVQSLLRSTHTTDGITGIIAEPAALQDRTSRQTKAAAGFLGVPAAFPAAFGELIAAKGTDVRISQLGARQVYLNQKAADTLNARAGDRLVIFIDGRPVPMVVRSIVRDSGLATGYSGRDLRSNPEVIMPLARAQQLTGHPGQITSVIISNRGDALSGASFSNTVARTLKPLDGYSVKKIKQRMLHAANQAGSEFVTGFITFGLFSIASGIILIVLIFLMLGAERRTEMGIARAVGTKRRHLIQQFLFEGYIYDLAASLIGVALGVVVGLGLVSIMASLLQGAGTDFILLRHIEPRSMIVAFCLGALVTFLTVLGASWRASRLNVAAAIRDLPEELHVDGSIRAAFTRPLADLAGGWRRLQLGRVLGASKAWLAAPWHLVTAFRVFISRGPVLLVAGWLLFALGNSDKQAFPYTAGISLMLIGAAMLVRWALVAFQVRDSVRNRIGYSLAGLSLVGFWLLPFDFFRSDLSVGIEMFFLSGMMLMLGGVWTVMYNLDVLLAGLTRLTGGLSRLTPILRTAITYPTQHRMRTGLTVFMFALVVFALMVEAVLVGSFGSQRLDFNRDSGGYQLYGDLHSAVAIPHLQQRIHTSPVLHGRINSAGAVSELTVDLQQAGQHDIVRYFANVADRAYLTGTHFTLHSRASGYTSDHAVWQTLADHPGYAVIDARFVAANNGRSGGFTYRGVTYQATRFTPFTIDMTDDRTGDLIPLTAIGIVDPRIGIAPGVYLSRSTLADNRDAPPAPTRYYFRIAPRQSVHQAALALGSTFLAYGLDVQDVQAQYDQNASLEIGFNNMLEAFMALGLIVGIAALGVIATRSVVERRQEIGMLRAIGFRRQMIARTFLLESSFVCVLGTLIGLVLGLLLGYQVVAFFAKTDPGLHFAVPWLEVAAIVLATYLASLLTTYLPAWQASRIYPAEALRYE
jgi:putative ABC transport system permease protein